MIIQFELGPEYKRTVAELGSAGRKIKQAISVGLGKGVKIAAGIVVNNYLSGQALKRRSGQLARAVDGWLESDTDGVVGVRDDAGVAKYKWLLTDEQKTIVPRNSKYLAIPIGENLTGAGVAKYSSPRQIKDGFFVRTGGKLLFGRKNGKRGKFRAMFVLVKSVFVQGSGALYDGVEESLDDITDQMHIELDKVI